MISLGIVQVPIRDKYGYNIIYRLWYSQAMKCVKATSHIPELAGDRPLSMYMEYDDFKTLRPALAKVIADGRDYFDKAF